MTQTARAAEAPPRVQRRRIDGVLLLDKAEGISSNHALQQVKRLFTAEKAGHTGTLDPFASGLLPICFGEATKFSSFGLEANKRYEATLQLGVTTDTGDREGRELARRPVAVGAAAIETVLVSLRGRIMQTPPMYSAVNKDGRRLYEYAREGIQVERSQREVTIHELTLRERRGDLLDVSVSCSKGTYVRTLAEQIGERLGCGAHLRALRRTASGGFSVAAALTWQALQQLGAAAREARLLAADALLAHLPQIDLDASQASAIRQGRGIDATQGSWRAAPETSVLRAYTEGRFLGVVCRQGGELRAQRLLAG